MVGEVKNIAWRDSPQVLQYQLQLLQSGQKEGADIHPPCPWLPPCPVNAMGGNIQFNSNYTQDDPFLTRSRRLSIPGLTSRYNLRRPRAAEVTALSRLFLYSIKSPRRSSSIAHGCLLQTSRIEFNPAAITSLATPGWMNSLEILRMTGMRASGGVKSCTDWARATKMAGTRSCL